MDKEEVTQTGTAFDVWQPPSSSHSSRVAKNLPFDVADELAAALKRETDATEAVRWMRFAAKILPAIEECWRQAFLLAQGDYALMLRLSGYLECLEALKDLAEQYAADKPQAEQEVKELTAQAVAETQPTGDAVEG